MKQDCKHNCINYAWVSRHIDFVLKDLGMSSDANTQELLSRVAHHPACLDYGKVTPFNQRVRPSDALTARKGGV